MANERQKPDYELRLERANDHIKRINELTEPFVKGYGNAFVFESDPANIELPLSLIFREKKETQIPIGLGLDIGEALHCLRSSLDYIAHTLCRKGSSIPLTREQIKSIEFPIFGERAPKQNEWDRKIGSADSTAQDIIRKIQPHLSGDYTVHPLWVLHELNNVDKHRMLHPVLTARQITDIRNINATVERMRIQHRGGLKDGDVVLRARISDSTQGVKGHLEVDTAIFVGFGDTPVVPYEPVTGVLRRVADYIHTEIVTPLLTFL